LSVPVMVAEPGATDVAANVATSAPAATVTLAGTVTAEDDEAIAIADGLPTGVARVTVQLAA
jgi:hypothetical protein